MRIIRFILTILFSGFLQSGSFAGARGIDVFMPVPPEKISVKASSEYPEFQSEESINGSGMTGNFHISHNLGKNMWLSAISTTPVKAEEQLHEGVVWLLYGFEEVQNLDLIKIWNHNQDNHTNRGLKKVYLQYSADGEKWLTLKNGDQDFFIIPESKGRKEEPASFHLALNNLPVKYFCITADLQEGNHYRDHSARTLEEAKRYNQNIDYYGISEIRFYNKTRQNVEDLPKIAAIDFLPAPGYRKTGDGPSREFKIKFDHPLYAGAEIEVSTGGKTAVDQIPVSETGIYEFTSLFPPGMMEQTSTVDFTFLSQQGTIRKKTEVEGARKWTVYFLPHSHLDIGYTHNHGDVMALQLTNIKRALELIGQTKTYPDGSKFKWNLEASWPVTEYLNRYKNKPEAQLFRDALKRGDLELHASAGSILTGLCKQEELTHMFDDALRIGKEIEIPVRSVMMSDIPGVAWGTVTAMAQNGLKYLSMAPNYVPFLETGGSRVGWSHIEWGDYPFYWQSQSGDEKVLLWSAGKGYSLFHDWLGGRLSSSGLEPIWNYLSELEEKEFPYDITGLRYTIHGDNGPPDSDMSDIIRQWNETYESPKFIIGTTHELFSGFEEKYHDRIPAFKGDFTPYWEEGAASTAAELAMNRLNAERLNQLEILWSIIGNSEYPQEDFDAAWKNVVLFSEHTWGASASGPEPESEFTKTLWREKQAFALKADSLALTISQKAATALSGKGEAKYIHVFNTNLWSRNDVVRFSSSRNLAGAVLSDETGREIPLQKTGEGEWNFVAKDVQPLSSKVYEIKFPASRKAPAKTTLSVHDNQISNEYFVITIDKRSGAISSLINKRTGAEYASEAGLNEYIYTGRNASFPKYVEQVKEIVALNSGTVSATLRVISEAPGCHSLTRDITLYEGIDRVDIKNTVDKKNVTERENVRFKFPFNVSNSETVIDLAFGEMRPEQDQLAGSNKNFYCANNGVTVTGSKGGILLTTVATPILEIGEMTGEAWMQDTKEFLAWKRTATPSSTVYSWVMNNSWRTNYKASQEGKVSFDYSLIPVSPDAQESKMKSAEVAQPMMAMLSDQALPYMFMKAPDQGVSSSPLSQQVLPDKFMKAPAKGVSSSLTAGHALPDGHMFRLQGKNKIAVSTIRPLKDKSGYLVRLVNLSGQPACSTIECGTMQPAASEITTERIKTPDIYLSDNQEHQIMKLDNDAVWMKPFGTLTLRIEQTDKNKTTH